MTDCTTIPTLAEIEASKVAMDDINSFTYLSADTFVDGESVTRDTVNGRLKKMGYQVAIPYVGGIVFSVSDNVKTVDKSGTIYGPVPSKLPFITDGNFSVDSNKFFVLQLDFSGNDGASRIGTTSGVTVQDELDSLNTGQIGGIVTFITKALLDAFTPSGATEENTSYKVTNDSTSSNNGYYHWNGLDFIKDADLVQNTIDEFNNSEGVSGKAVFDHVVDSVNVNTPTNIIVDELLLSNRSLDIFDTTGWKLQSNIGSYVIDTTEKITGSVNNCKATLTAIADSGTIMEHRTYVDGYLFSQNKVNLSVTLLFAVSEDIQIALYKYAPIANAIPIVDFITYSVIADIPLTVNLQGLIPVGQETDIDYLAFLVRPLGTNVAFNNEVLYCSTPYIYGGDRVQFNNSIQNLSAKFRLINPHRRFPYTELFQSAGLSGAVPVGSTGVSGFKDPSRSTVTFDNNLYFPGYNKMISFDVNAIAGLGTKSSYSLERLDALKSDLLITKKIKFQSVFRFPVKTSVKIGMYLLSPTGDRWLDGSEANTFLFDADTNKVVLSEGVLTDVELAQFTSIRLFIRQDVENTPQLDGQTFYTDSWNMYAGDIDEALVDFSASQDFKNQIDTWGDSITASGGYQDTLAAGTGLAVNNHGVSSEWTQMIRKRFVDYYTANPDKLRNFILIFMGTNNLINFNRGAGPDVTDPLYDQLYAQSYRDQFYRDLNIMLDMIPHNNYLVIGGHAGTNVSNTEDNWLAMDDVDSRLQKSHPSNSISLRDSLLEDSDFLDTVVTVNFVKPSVAGSVDITVSDENWINTNGNTGSICIGTKDLYDEYSVDSVLADVFTCTLDVDGGHFPVGHTMQAVYHLQADLNRGDDDISLAVYSKEDIFSYANGNIPRSSSSDGVHFTTETYDRVGDIFADRVNQVVHKFETV